MRNLKKPTIIDIVMNEVALYGGLPLRRYDILKLARVHLGGGAKEPFGAQYFAFHGPVVDLEPWSLEDALAVMEAK